MDLARQGRSCATATTDRGTSAPLRALPARTLTHLRARPRHGLIAWRGGALMTIEFLITSLIVVVSPGTGVLYTLAAGLSRGARASVIAAFGCTLGILPHMTAAIIGLAALLHASALAFQTLKYLGVAYLLYMAWNALREQGALRVEKEIGTRSAMQVITTAILINILNPKLSIFFYAFLPQFVSANEPRPLSRMFELSTVFMVLTFA